MLGKILQGFIATTSVQVTKLSPLYRASYMCSICTLSETDGTNWTSKIQQDRFKKKEKKKSIFVYIEVICEGTNL